MTKLPAEGADIGAARGMHGIRMPNRKFESYKKGWSGL